MTSDRGTGGGAELELNTPVTPKSPALNPNALEFLSTKTSTSSVADTGQWAPPDQNDSGIHNCTTNSNTTADFSLANGDVSGDSKSDVGLFSPASESPFQQDFSSFTDNQNFSDTNTDAPTKPVDQSAGGPMGNLSVDSPQSYPASESAFASGAGEGVTPMTGIQEGEVGSSSGQEGEGSSTDGNLSGEQLRQVLKTQLESYFSRENLSSDTYLQSQMDADQYVPIATVANLDQIQRLTSDLSLIVDLLRESTFVQVDEKGEKVRPNLNRCIVILREIPNTTPVQEVQNLFSGQNCPKFLKCEFAHNDNWYVTFDSDADAQRAYQYLREEVRTFQGKPIMARIKAKPLIRTYQPRNGYINKRYPQQGVGPSMSEIVTPSSTATPQQQFTATQPFTIMPSVTQYPLTGQQAMPFYPPPNPLLQTWQAASPPMLDPSMVLAMNGYQATQVKDYSSVTTSRNPFNNINRNNRNQKMHGNGPMGRDRINSNESLPPRLQHQHDRQNGGPNNMHKTSPRNLDNHNHNQISNSVPVYHNRRMEGPHSGHMSHGSHSNHGGPSHTGGGSHHGPHHHSSQQQQHLDSANNNSLPNSRGGPEPVSQRYPASSKPNSYSYKSRRRRDDDGARPNRSNSSQMSQREGGGSAGPPAGRQASMDKFDYEPTSFPPLPGSGNNTTMGEKYENKLSDVVKGTAKMAVKDPGPLKSSSTAGTMSGTTTVITATTASTHTTTPVNLWENKENQDSTSSSQGLASSSSPDSTIAVATAPTHTPKSSSGTASTHSTSVSNQVRSTSKPSEIAVPDPKSSDKPLVQQQSSLDDKTASVSAASVRLSYAQMVQRTKVAEVSASSVADCSEGSDSDVADTPLQQSNRPNVTLKEQGQHSSQSSAKTSARGSMKDFSRKDSREEHDDSKRDDLRKENDYRRDELPREQRMGGRRAKENRERRYGDRENWRRNDRRDRDGLREGPRTAVAK